MNAWYPLYLYLYPYAYLPPALITIEIDSDVEKPKKFTGQDPCQLPPFIANCIMAFDNKPHKFQMDHQSVSYAASYLTDIAMSWWQPYLMQQPEPPIHHELNTLFREADLEQSSKCALKCLKMQDNHSVNHYMTSFSEHASYTHWNEAALYDAFYAGLAKRLKDQLLTVE